MRALRRAALFVAAACASASPFSAPVFGSQAVAKDFGAAAGRPAETRVYAGAGFAFLRTDVDWWTVEPETPGQYNFTLYDALLEDLVGWGRTPYMTLNHWTKVWGGLSPVTPVQIEAFVNFSLAVVGRYKGKGVIWEIYNEPNGNLAGSNCSSTTAAAAEPSSSLLSKGDDAPSPSPLASWNPCANVTQYAALALATASALKRAYPSETVVVGALRSLSEDPPGNVTVDFPFLTALAASGVLAHADGVSVHFYRTTSPESVEGDVEAVRALLAEHTPPGQAPPALLSGEWGYQTGPFPHPYWPLVDATTQAKYLARMSLFNAGIGVNVTTWFEWRDGPNATTVDDDNFGVVEHAYQNETVPFVPKLAYTAAVALYGGTGNGPVLEGMSRYEVEGVVGGAGAAAADAEAATTNATCFVVYWDAGFLTTYYTAWCDAPEGWQGNVTFPDTFGGAGGAGRGVRGGGGGVCIGTADWLGRDMGYLCSSGGVFTTPVTNGPLYVRDQRRR
jgi:hypothetical protein